MNKIKVAVISDTHGLVRPQLIEELAGCDLIIHAGDIGSNEVINELEKVAPVRAVRGNVDREEWCLKFPKSDVIELGDKYVYLIHNIEDLDIEPTAGGFDIVIYGHSHKPSVEEKKGVIYLNPGSVGPRRFNLPISYAILEVKKNSISQSLITITNKNM
ncbi:metallophosphoesterase family protein [Serpentinicella alkaliphila]|uniref:Phosphoesterase n=1 Tax=Serpentinicella alkaliphila TaxID=1734049 RepID=A0A4R2U8S9_9FIRM|nr:metallophosphoesterase family protein [Serpentinicella alkaliphila]QUH25630.1 metallophosphoesterase family protein [Serpentinicella alkaliphila]TCQ06659.1 hypothetical protein EDD79_100385 [Serpentinicella alkaliphila]